MLDGNLESIVGKGNFGNFEGILSSPEMKLNSGVEVLSHNDLGLAKILSSSAKLGSGVKGSGVGFYLPEGVKILDSPEEVYAAMKLRYDVYQQTEFAHFFDDPRGIVYGPQDETSVILGYVAPNSSDLVGSLSLDIGDTLKSEKYGLNVDFLRDLGMNLGELHGLVIDPSYRMKPFRPLFNAMELIGSEINLDGYMMVMRDELLKLYRKFDRVATHSKFDSFMGIDISQTALLWAPPRIERENLNINELAA